MCVPHAGGSPIVFHRWVAALAADGVAVRPVLWDAIAESTGETCGITARAESLAAQVGQLRGPWALLGHSLGALIATETVRHVARRGGRLPRRLVLCGAAAPGHGVSAAPLVAAPDSDVIDFLRLLGGTPEEAFTDPDVRAMLLQRFRRDLALLNGYQPTLDAPLPCPVAVYGGTVDPVVPVAALASWLDLAPDAQVRLFEGGHFFLHDDFVAVRAALLEDCQVGHADRPAGGHGDRPTAGPLRTDSPATAPEGVQWNC
ncbi:thioesterase II family protein [Micromonospora sp. B006]|uniref:thioesterase II family protein n=1 Tax=Micromonospora sp. B006 TaxID=2201999 RepID=UPI000E32D53A|nr:alpha/beta fold hydrolase [Micromonospora sp. B006]AXO35395.1 thioesterase [Micromonospora sp. B006]